MKLTNVNIHAIGSNNVINLSFRDPKNLNSYIAKEILGLDADEITPKFLANSTTGNHRYYDFTLGKRDIVIQVLLNPNFSIGETHAALRDKIYKLVSSTRTGEIEVSFKDGAVNVARVSGFVTKIESPKFTKSPEVQITISCNDSMLKAYVADNVDVVGLSPTNAVVLDSKSTSPHGFKFGVSFTNLRTEFSIQELSTGVPPREFKINLIGSPLLGFGGDDILSFSSEHNDRFVYLQRDGVIYHLMDRVLPNSIWPIMFPGNNNFKLSVGAKWVWFNYHATYWGV